MRVRWLKWPGFGLLATVVMVLCAAGILHIKRYITVIRPWEKRGGIRLEHRLGLDQNPGKVLGADPDMCLFRTPYNPSYLYCLTDREEVLWVTVAPEDEQNLYELNIQVGSSANPLDEWATLKVSKTTGRIKSLQIWLTGKTGERMFKDFNFDGTYDVRAKIGKSVELLYQGDWMRAKQDEGEWKAKVNGTWVPFVFKDGQWVQKGQ